MTPTSKNLLDSIKNFARNNFSSKRLISPIPDRQIIRPAINPVSSFKPLANLQKRFQQAELAKISTQRYQPYQNLKKTTSAFSSEFSEPMKRYGTAVGTALVSPFESRRLAQEARTGESLAQSKNPAISRGGQRLLQQTAQQRQDFSKKLSSVPKNLVTGYGGTALTLLGGQNALPSMAIGAVLGGGITALTGGNFYEGLGRGAGTGPRVAGLNRITSPVIDPIVQVMGAGKPLATKMLARALSHGGLNVAEDNIYEALTQGGVQNIDQNIQSFLMGAATSPLVKYDPNNSFLKIVDDNKLVFDGKRFRNIYGQYAKSVNVPIKKAEQQIRNFTKWYNEPIAIRNEEYPGSVRYVKRGEQGFIKPDEFLPKTKTQTANVAQPPKGIDDSLNLVREAISEGQIDAAQDIHHNIKGNKPAFDKLVQEVESWQKTATNEGKSMLKNRYGDYQEVVDKFRQFLRLQGENISKETGMLHRESIPRSVFGQSSDEVASALGKSEREFMDEITNDLNMAGKGTATIQQIARLDKNIKKIKGIFSKLKLDKKYYKPIQDQIGQNLGVTAEATPQTLKKIAQRSQQALEKTAKKEFDDWQRQVFQNTRTTTGAVNQAVGSIKKATTSPLSNPEGMKDVGGVKAYMRDVYRNFKEVYGPRYPEVKRMVLDPFDKSKGNLSRAYENWANRLNKEVVNGLGIKKGSKQSALTQLYGEGKITLEELKAQAGPDWQKVIEADKWFRREYDKLLSEVNATRKRIYPNDPTKIIKKRSDYYRHFREMGEGISGLRNIFDSPANIASGLAGQSDFTKPKTKWLSFAQKRLGDQSDIDAVGGFLDYIKAAEYAKHIDPHIAKFRALAEELSAQTEQGTDNAGKLNGFIEFLQDYTNDLAGKTNPADRFIQKVMGRKAFRVINWANNRIKANVILGNASSSIAQIFNVPQGIANAGLGNSLKGFGRSMASIFTDDGVIKQSDFLKERYGGNVFDQFDSGMIKDVKKFAAWMTGALDEVGSRFIWQSHYAKAVDEGIPNPIKYADDITRDMVAGRGIGEVPILQKAKTFQLVAPFQLEVANLWWVMKDFVDEKQFGKLATLFVSSYVMNKAAEQVRGSDVVFDPIQSLVDSWGVIQDEDDNKALRVGGRISGEVLSNLPGGQSLASIYPEYGFKAGDKQYPTREALFGDADPTRFGSGVLQSGLQDPLYKLAPPFGGQQIKRTIEGMLASKKGYSESKTGKVRFPTENNLGRNMQRAVFGQYSTPNARAYFDEDRSVLGENQSTILKNAPNKQEAYDKIISSRKQNSLVDKAKESLKTDKKVEGARPDSYQIGGVKQEGYSIGDRFIFMDEDGEVKTKSIESIKKSEKKEEKSLVDTKYSLVKDRLTRSKNYKELYAVNKQYLDFLKEYQKQLDPKTDQKEIISLQNKIEDLEAVLAKGVKSGGSKKKTISDAQLLSAYKKALKAFSAPSKTRLTSSAQPISVGVPRLKNAPIRQLV